MTLKIAVLGSTKGTDLGAIIDAIEAKELNAKISIVLSNKNDAFILERAAKHKIKNLFLNPKDFSSREEYDKKLIELIQKEKSDLVLLIGWMRILSKEFCEAFKERAWNIHPSLLPEFAGGMDLNVHEEVLKARKKITGCTLHLVEAGVDAGKIIAQKKVKVLAGDNSEALKARVQKAEQELLVEEIRKLTQKQ